MNLKCYHKLTPVLSYVHQIEIGSDRTGGAHIYGLYNHGLLCRDLHIARIFSEVQVRIILSFFVKYRSQLISEDKVHVTAMQYVGLLDTLGFLSECLHVVQ